MNFNHPHARDYCKNLTTTSVHPHHHFCRRCRHRHFLTPHHFHIYYYCRLHSLLLKLTTITNKLSYRKSLYANLYFVFISRFSVIKGSHCPIGFHKLQPFLRSCSAQNSQSHSLTDLYCSQANLDMSYLRSILSE